MKRIKADLMMISVCIQLRKCQICCSQFNKKEHYQIGENTLSDRRKYTLTQMQSSTSADSAMST